MRIQSQRETFPNRVAGLADLSNEDWEKLKATQPDIYDQFEQFRNPPKWDGKWYHASPADLPVGTHLTPGGGKAPSSDFYEMMGDDGRANYLWVSPDLDDAHFWAASQNAPYIYEVKPDNEPSPWGLGADGYVTNGAVIVRRV